jgi:hypothetical protein
MPWALTQAESHNAPHIGLLDWVLYGIKASNIRFGLKFIEAKAGVIDAARLAAFWRCARDPEGVDWRDILSVVCGGLPDGAKVNEPPKPLFNPDLFGVSYDQAISIDGGTTWGQVQAGGAAAEVEHADLFPWQRRIADKYEQPEDGRFGREIHWYYETIGNVGKSILLRYLVDKCDGIQVDGKADNVFFCIAEFVKTHGVGPKIVCLDLARTTGDIDFTMIEKVKDGRFLSGKYRSVLVRYSRPHFLVFSNQPPPDGCLSQDRLVVTDLRGADFSADVDIADRTTLRDVHSVGDGASAGVGGLSAPLGVVATTRLANVTYNMNGTTEAVHGGGQPQQQRGHWAQRHPPPSKRRCRPISSDEEDSENDE